MAFIGNTVQNQGFTPAIDYFNGNGVTVTFTLSRPVASVAQVIVAVDNVIQNPSSAFGVVGNSITFTSAPLSGTNNIWVEYTSLITTYQGISQDPTVIGDIRATGGYLAEGDFGNSFIDGNLIDYVTGRGRFTVGELDDITFYHGGTAGRSAMMDLYYAGGAKIYGTTALTIPVGTTAERPGTPASGMVRMNSTTGNPEWYNTISSSWVPFSSAAYTVEYLVIAGGAGGGGSTEGHQGGGGGAGGYRSSVTGESSGGGSSAEPVATLNPGTSYTVTIGSGGAGSPTGSRGVSGGDSVFSTVTSVGGGGGGAGSNAGTNRVGSSGGCGGGNASSDQSPNGSAPLGTAGQGYAGGVGSTGPGWGGTGGGAGAAGTSNSSGAGFSLAGGAGVASSITGSSVTRAVGGGVTGYTLSGNNGATNTGGGGWGGTTGTTTGYNGGSGLVVIRYLGAQKGTGGTVTSSGGYTIHTFTSSGTYVA